MSSAVAHNAHSDSLTCPVQLKIPSSFAENDFSHSQNRNSQLHKYTMTSCDVTRYTGRQIITTTHHTLHRVCAG